MEKLPRGQTTPRLPWISVPGADVSHRTANRIVEIGVEDEHELKSVWPSLNMYDVKEDAGLSHGEQENRGTEY